MTNNEILKADLLDILFEHRNKSYGAYALRRYYNNRLLIALGIALSAVLLFFLLSLLNRSGGQNNTIRPEDNNAVILTDIDLKEKEKPLPPPPPPPPKIKEPVAEVKDLPITVVPDIEAEVIPDQKEIEESAISNRNVDGKTPEDPNKAVTNGVLQTGTGKEEEKQVDFKPIEMPPSFPGGPEALALFFSRTLSSPSDLEVGEKRVILVRFVVGADGSITKTEIVQSGGNSYDGEVLRAFKRMPRWNPAIQNGIKVATTFTQPVTFIGMEQ